MKVVKDVDKSQVVSATGGTSRYSRGLKIFAGLVLVSAASYTLSALVFIYLKGEELTTHHLKTYVPVLPQPFYRPFQYVGMPLTEAAKLIGVNSSTTDYISFANEHAYISLEAKENIVGFVDVELKRSGPCKVSVPFESEPVLSAIGISPTELAFVRKSTFAHVYYDHKRKLKVSVICHHTNGGPLNVSFSSKYYGM
jgi:hypothetical protein